MARVASWLQFPLQELIAPTTNGKRRRHRLPELPTPTPPKARKSKRSKNVPAFDLSQALYRMTGVDLTQVDGLEALTVQTFLTEIGTNMSTWPTVKHFTSWLGVAPNNKITGCEVKSRTSKKANNRANTALRRTALSLARSQSALGTFYRRIPAKRSPPQPIAWPALCTLCYSDGSRIVILGQKSMPSASKHGPFITCNVAQPSWECAWSPSLLPNQLLSRTAGIIG